MDNTVINRYSKKLLAVILFAALIFSSIPINAFATNIPSWDGALGNVTVTANGATAMLNAEARLNCGFEGWFKNGKLVSYERKFEIPTTDAGLYTAKFVNFNLINDGNFENYVSGDDMTLKTNESKWGTTVAGEIKVTDERRYNGSKSLLISGLSGTAYRCISGLDTNSHYTLTFYYYGDASNYLTYASVVDADNKITNNANKGEKALGYRSFAELSTAGWQKAKISLYTGDSDKAALLLAATGNCYVDDLSLIKTNLAAPSYNDQTFDNGYVGDFYSDDLLFLEPSLDKENERLKIDGKLSGSHLYLTPYYLKEGYTYKFTFDVDLTEIPNDDLYRYVPKVDYDKKALKKDSSGNYIYAETGSVKDYNFFCWSFSREDKAFGGTGNDKCFYIGETDDTGWRYESTTHSGVNNTSYADTNRRKSVGRFQVFSDTENLYDDKPVTVENTFTAQYSGPCYFSARLNGIGTYYIDNLKVEVTGEPTDKSNLIVGDAFKPLGVAVRTTGNQGIRFKTRIDKQLLTADNEYGVRVTEYGTLAAKTEKIDYDPTNVIHPSDVNFNAAYANKIIGDDIPAYNGTGGRDIIYADMPDYKDFTGVLINISEANYQNGYSVRSYLKYTDKDGKEHIAYSDGAVGGTDASIYYVAKAAYSAKNPDGSFREDDAARNHLYSKILSKAFDREVTIDNENVVYKGFDGVNSTVYHCYTFMENGHNTAYTDEQAAIEMDRLVDSGITSVRTNFASSFCADNTGNRLWQANSSGQKVSENFGGWDWETDKMQAVYKWAKMLQDRNIDIILNAGWQLHFITNKEEASVYELFYLLGYDEVGYSETRNGVTYTYGVADKYGETAKYEAKYGKLPTLAECEADSTGALLEQRRMVIASLRYGEWVRQALEAFRAHNIYNVKCLHPFTESGYAHKEGDAYPTYHYDEYITMVKGLHFALTEAGIRDRYKIIGPSQAIAKKDNRQTALVEYYLDWETKNPEFKGMIDVLSSHTYPQPSQYTGYNSNDPSTLDSIYDPDGCYLSANETFEYYKEMRAADTLEGREFWIDECFAKCNKDAYWTKGVGAQLTQFAAGMTAAINNGINRLLTWQIFDQCWSNQEPFSTTEYIGGVHVTGTCPSFVGIEKQCNKAGCTACSDYYHYSSYTPRVTYYGLNLLGKYLSNKNADVYGTSVAGNGAEADMYVSSLKLEDGRTAVLAVNTGSEATNVSFNFKKDVGYDFVRYTYNPDGITPTEKAESIKSDGKVTNINGSFYDTVAAMSFAIYICEKEPYRNDTDMNAGEMD